MINVTKSDLPDFEAYTQCLKRIWSNCWLTNDGEFVRLLESGLKSYLDAEGLVLVSNGTLALELALRVLRLEGEVITTPFTFAATTNAIIWERLTPVFADIDPETFNIDPCEVEKKITDKTSAILAVHVYGNPCYVDKLQEIASKYDLKLICDAAHAFGVEYEGQSVLNYGDISTLSFHATKIFNTAEGGALVVKDKDVIEELELVRNHGIASEEEVVLPGTNAKMNELQAAMGVCNLAAMDEKIARRKTIYEYYKDKLAGLNVKFQKIIASRYNYSYMPVCLENNRKRDEVFAELVNHDIKPRKYFYPLTVNYDYFKNRSADPIDQHDLKSAFEISQTVLCLPLYPDLEIKVVDDIVDIIGRLAG
ncbi:MAG: DegT/DnrJ/EryC1/StrS family aminotransferase [Planctomycetota bacterium]|jgi:dTDP-4-amino-4,6-dideoxygalactose transaminase